MREFIRECAPTMILLSPIVTVISFVENADWFSLLTAPLGMLVGLLMWLWGTGWTTRKWYNMQLFVAAFHTGSPDMADQVLDFFGLDLNPNWDGIASDDDRLTLL